MDNSLKPIGLPELINEDESETGIPASQLIDIRKVIVLNLIKVSGFIKI